MSQQRYEKEIEDILEKAGSSPSPEPQRNLPPGPPPPNRRRRTSYSRVVSLLRAVTSYKGVLLLGIVLIVISSISGSLYLFLGGVAFLVAGYVMYYRAPRSGGGSGDEESPTTKMWRGRSLDSDDPPDRR